VTTSLPFSMSHSLTVLSADTEASTFEAVGWKRSSVTFLSCPCRSPSGSEMLSVRPPSGMPQIWRQAQRVKVASPTSRTRRGYISP
jgi:hypothetical protein